MNANELRVGNKVTIDNEVSWSKLKGEVMTVIGVSKITDIERMVLFPKSKYNISLEDCNGNLYHQFDEFIIPIPLSPEILEKCGFEADNKTEYGGWLSPEIIGGSRLRLVKEDVGFSFFNGICKTVVKDLHTLQNYYPAWTSGEELTYKQ